MIKIPNAYIHVVAKSIEAAYVKTGHFSDDEHREITEDDEYAARQAIENFILLLPLIIREEVIQLLEVIVEENAKPII